MKKPIYSFDSTTSLGIDQVPNNSLVLIEDSSAAAGISPKFVYLYDRSSLSGSTTIADFLAITDAWYDIGASSTITDFVTTLDQTVFTVNYNPNNVSVYSGGVKMKATEYTAADGVTITLNLPQDEDTWISVVSDNASGGGTSISWGNVTGTPTTISGYGITDAYAKSLLYTKSESYNNTEVYNKSESYNNTEVYTKSEIDTRGWSWNDITSDVPTTISGYGITDPVVVSDITQDAGASIVENIVIMTQAEYDAITPNATTVYMIVG